MYKEYIMLKGLQTTDLNPKPTQKESKKILSWPSSEPRSLGTSTDTLANSATLLLIDTEHLSKVTFIFKKSLFVVLYKPYERTPCVKFL
jgi:hypothetical protein